VVIEHREPETEDRTRVSSSDGQVDRRWRMSEDADEKECQRYELVERTGSGGLHCSADNGKSINVANLNLMRSAARSR